MSILFKYQGLYKMAWAGFRQLIDKKELDIYNAMRHLWVN